MTKTYTMLPNGSRIKLRREQMLIWSVVAGFLGAAFIAGLYFGILEVNWHIFWLKPWWDGLFHESWWPVYRHEAFRDIPEPAFATMGVLTLIAKQKYWNVRVSNFRLAFTPILLTVLTFGLGILGTWLLNFAFGHPVLQWHSIGNLLLGFLIGRILHFIWAPVGATIQGNLLETHADYAANHERVPVWVRYPLAPPVLRERFAVMYAKSSKVTGNLYGEDSKRGWLVGILVTVFIAVTVIGILGHYWVGTGHTLSFLPTTR